MQKILPFIIVLATLFSCNHRDRLADAYGNFEVEDVIVSAEASGKLLSFNVEEGRAIAANVNVGLVDTITVVLQLQQLEAQMIAVNSKISNVKAQIEAQKQQKENLLVNVDRVGKLLKSGAATQQQKDDLDGQLKLVEKQIEATKTQTGSIQKEASVLAAQKELLMEQLKRCEINSPVDGTVLEKYVKAGEMVAAGKPLFKVADLSSLELRCYISGEKLSSIKLGQTVQVAIDGENGGMEQLTGTVSWISSQAEFTPKIIQTKEERVKLVYALKVKVQNDGRLKIGMPGEIRLAANN